jgi:hypothetical protein
MPGLRARHSLAVSQRQGSCVSGTGTDTFSGSAPPAAAAPGGSSAKPDRSRMRSSDTSNAPRNRIVCEGGGSLESTGGRGTCSQPKHVVTAPLRAATTRGESDQAHDASSDPLGVVAQLLVGNRGAYGSPTDARGSDAAPPPFPLPVEPPSEAPLLRSLSNAPSASLAAGRRRTHAVPPPPCPVARSNAATALVGS